LIFLRRALLYQAAPSLSSLILLFDGRVTQSHQETTFNLNHSLKTHHSKSGFSHSGRPLCDNRRPQNWALGCRLEFLFSQDSDDGKSLAHFCHLPAGSADPTPPTTVPAGPATELQQKPQFLNKESSFSSLLLLPGGQVTRRHQEKASPSRDVSLEPPTDFGCSRGKCHFSQGPACGGGITCIPRAVPFTTPLPQCYAGLGTVVHTLLHGTTTFSQLGKPAAFGKSYLKRLGWRVRFLPSERWRIVIWYRSTNILEDPTASVFRTEQSNVGILGSKRGKVNVRHDSSRHSPDYFSRYISLLNDVISAA
jgi:hypothetical protein